jgi:ATP adenylyltransferase
MEYLWAPWRMEYIKNAQGKKEEGCILCDKPAAGDDAANLVLYRGRYNFVIMNAFPYNGGHLMIAPFAHTNQLSALEVAVRHEHLDIVSQSVDILKEAMKPAGFNIGLNLGRIAGAGVDQHLHTHIVPRWEGDTNFMPVMADIKVVNESLGATYAHLKPYFEALK